MLKIETRLDCIDDAATSLHRVIKEQVGLIRQHTRMLTATVDEMEVMLGKQRDCEVEERIKLDRALWEKEHEQERQML